MTFGEYFRSQALYVSSVLDISLEQAIKDIRYIAIQTLGIELPGLFSISHHIIEQRQQQLIQSKIDRLCQHEPLAYILGHQDFYNDRFLVNLNVLIPRQESEIVVDTILNDIKARSDHIYPNNPINILELGVGSGCISISISKELNKFGIVHRLIATDKSSDALSVAKANADALQAADIQFLHHDWNNQMPLGALDALDVKGFDIVVSNPPYIPNNTKLEPSVALFEPSIALFAQQNGMQDYILILNNQKSIMRPGCLIYFELGYDTWPKLLEELQLSHMQIFRVLQTYNDLLGHVRLVKLQYNPE